MDLKGRDTARWEYVKDLLARKPAVPPYSKEVIDFYKIKLAKLRLSDVSTHPRIIYEIKHCCEVLESVKRLEVMERRQRRLHDKNPPTIRPPKEVS